MIRAKDVVFHETCLYGTIKERESSKSSREYTNCDEDESNADHHEQLVDPEADEEVSDH